MTYNEIIQKVGKRIIKHVYYFVNGERINVNDSNVVQVKFNTLTPLIGLSITECEIVLKEPINGDIYIDVESRYGSNIATKTYGAFYLKENPKYNASKKEYTHKTYNKILKSMVDYEAINIVFPCTVFQFFQKLVQNLGYTTNISSLPNGARTMSVDIYNGINFTFRDVLEDIAVANGVLLWLDDNELKIANLGENEITINDDILKNQNIDFGKHYGKINRIVLSRSADSDKVYIEDSQSIEANGLCEFKISDNQLMNYNDRSDYLQALLNQLDGVEFDIYDTELVGFGDLIPLQNVKFTTGGNIYASYIFNNEVTLSDGYKQAIYNDEPEQSVSDYKVMDATDRRINETYLIVNKQNQTIESVITNVTEQNDKISQITQTVDELNSKIQDIADITIAGETNFATFDLDDINKSEPIMIKIHPILNNISYLYPRNNLYPSNNLYSPNRILRFYNKDLDENIDYELPDDLLFYDSENYDEFYLDYDSQTCQVIKRCGYNADGSIYKLASEQIVNYPYPSINLEDGDYTISLLGYNNGYVFARLMVQNIYTTQFATRAEVSSEINQTAFEINSRVALKTDKSEIISTINQSAEAITINANKINLQGYITASDLSGAGKTVINGSNITTGTISANRISGGTISGASFNVTGANAITVYGTDNLKDAELNRYGLYTYNDSGTYAGKCSAGNVSYSGNVYPGIGLISANGTRGFFTFNVGSQVVGNLHVTGTITQGSLESLKKNIVKYNENALGKVVNSDIYFYNYKDENDEEKGHLGFIIGENYKTPNELIRNDGIDIYSACSLLWKAVQEQQVEINNLKKEMEDLKNG